MFKQSFSMSLTKAAVSTIISMVEMLVVPFANADKALEKLRVIEERLFNERDVAKVKVSLSLPADGLKLFLPYAAFVADIVAVVQKHTPSLLRMGKLLSEAIVIETVMDDADGETYYHSGTIQELEQEKQEIHEEQIAFMRNSRKKAPRGFRMHFSMMQQMHHRVTSKIAQLLNPGYNEAGVKVTKVKDD